MKSEKVRELKGFSAKTENKIEKKLEQAGKEERIKLSRAEDFAAELLDYLNELTRTIYQQIFNNLTL